MKNSARVIALLAGMLVALVIGGCAVPGESRLDEFQAEGESISQQIAAAVPAELIADEASYDSRGQLAPSMGNTPQSPAWWQVGVSVALRDAPGTSETAATAIGAALIADGWEKAKEQGADNPIHKTDKYWRDGWYVEVGWVRSDPGMAESVSALVVSPDTVRGDHGDVSS